MSDLQIPKEKLDVRQWWADNPMTYGSVHGETSYADETGQLLAADIGSRKFFEQVDETFYSWNHPLHDQTGRFGRIFSYDRYRGKRVLEVGCGMGTMAMNWAQHGALMHAADLNPVAVTQTSTRFRLAGLPLSAVQVDGNVLPFPDNSFDYVYSWGVLHHSPDLERSIAELFRVLRPGGGFGVMLYHRRSILHWFIIRLIEGYLHGESQFLNELEMTSRYTDGDRKEGNPHTWPVTREEMRDLFGPHSADLKVDTLGTDVDFTLDQIVIAPALARLIPALARKPWARRWGWSLWMNGTKR